MTGALNRMNGVETPKAEADLEASEPLAAPADDQLPFVRVQVSPMRAVFILKRIPAELDRRIYADGKELTFWVRRVAPISRPMSLYDCGHIEAHYARYMVLPGWAMGLFLDYNPLPFDTKNQRPLLYQPPQ